MASDSTLKPADNVVKKIFADMLAPKTQLHHALYVLLFFSVLFTLFFSPVIFHSSLLAPGGGRLGDGLVSHLPYYLSEKLFWDPQLACGFPMIADSQAMSWYPPALLLSLLPGTWNIFVISAYVMAGCFTYGYVFTLTESKLAALVSGITYSMCGFMFAHLGHTAMIHSAVWLPLIIWSLEMLRRKPSRFWLAVGCLAVACCIFAGHLQIVVYSLIISAAYALVSGWTALSGRGRFYLFSSVLLLLGVGLAALQILPTAELASLSTRTDFTFSDFISYSFPLTHLPLLFFPASFGGLPHYGTIPYFGEWNIIEMTGYVGLLPPVLAAVGFFVSKRKPVCIFWLCVGVLALILTLGDQTPLAALIYRLPILSRFRVPARHFIEVALAVSVLAGFGVQAILRGRVTRRLMIIVIAAATLLLATNLLILLSSRLSQYALSRGVTLPEMIPWSNRAVGTPLVIFLIGIATFIYWRKKPSALHSRLLVLCVLFIDLASFGWFFNWHDFSPRKEVLNPPASAIAYRDLLRESHQRLLSIRGTLGTVDELPPNLSRVWGVPNATGYGPLIPSRFMYFLSILPDGSIASTWKNVADQSLNLTSVRYVFLPRSGATTDQDGVSWHDENMDIWLGAGCDHPPRDAVSFTLPEPFKVTSVGIVSRLACSLSVKDGEEVARLLVTDVEGNVRTEKILAGRDSSEWAYDCSNIKPQIQHSRAQVFSSFPTKMYDESCLGHFYVTKINFPDTKPISSVEIQWTGHSGSITIDKLSLINETTKNSEAINPLSIEGSQWRYLAEAGEARIYENPQALPRAWLASEVKQLKPEDILSAIKTSKLPDGSSFNPKRTALVEELVSIPAQSFDPAAAAQITQFSNTSMEVQTSSSAPSFLVTSDVYYPGWRASLDGAPIQLFRANYALRGVQVPAGKHLVRFEFRFKTFYYGAAISALSLLALIGFLALAPFFPKRSNKENEGQS